MLDKYLIFHDYQWLIFVEVWILSSNKILEYLSIEGYKTCFESKGPENRHRSNSNCSVGNIIGWSGRDSSCKKQYGQGGDACATKLEILNS